VAARTVRDVPASSDPTRPSAGQSTVEHLALGLAVAAVVALVATAVVHDVPGLMVGALRDALGRRPPALRDDSWALGSSTYRPLIRRYAPRLVLERDVWGHDDAVPVDPRRCRHAACARFGEATPTAFVHLKRLPTATYIAYWTYYPGSQTSHLPLAALRGAHRDDWEGLIVRLDASGAWARATAHGGFQGAGPWWTESSGWRAIGPHPTLHRAAGSHAGGFEAGGIDLAGDDWNGTLGVIEPSRLRLEPADRLPAARLRYDAETTAPWHKRAWVDADVPGTSASGHRGRNAALAARWAAASAPARRDGRERAAVRASRPEAAD
jgi:hypothetical protein